MSGGRDASKGKVYRTERLFWYGPGVTARPLPQATLTRTELEALLSKLLALGGAKVTNVEVRYRRKNHGGASYNGLKVRAPEGRNGEYVNLPDSEKVHRFEFNARSMVYWVAIHEVAHALVQERNPGRAYYSSLVLSHGWQFIAAYVDLVSLFYDATTAEGLLAKFRAAGLRDTPPRYFRWSVTNPEWQSEERSEYFRTNATKVVIATTAEAAAQEAWSRPLRYRARRDSWGYVTNEHMLGDPDLVAKKLGAVSYEEAVATYNEKRS